MCLSVLAANSIAVHVLDGEKPRMTCCCYWEKKPHLSPHVSVPGALNNMPLVKELVHKKYKGTCFHLPTVVSGHVNEVGFICLDFICPISALGLHVHRVVVVVVLR